MGLRYFFSSIQLWETPAQTAARIAIIDIELKFGKACKDHSISSDELEKRLIHHNMPLIESLVRDHELRKGIVSKYRKIMLYSLYNRAGSRRDYVWQAAFAKKHKL